MQKTVYILVFVLLAAVGFSRTVAISYFDNTSGEVKYNALSKGIADMLITDLSKVQGITIVEREKLEKLIGEIKLGQSKYFDQNTAQKLGKGLGAQTILTGAYFILGNEIRIDARLIDVESGGVVAAEEVTGSKTNFFTLHKQLAKLLSQSLKFPYNPNKNEFFENNSDVALTAVVSYSNAIDYQDKGLNEEAETILEKTAVQYPGFVFAKNKLEQVKENLKRLEAEREQIIAEQLKSTLDNLDPSSTSFGTDIATVWGNLMSSYKYSQILLFNDKLKKMGIEPTKKIYGEASPITFGEMVSFYDVTALATLKNREGVIEAGQAFLNNYTASMYFSSVKMSVEQAVKELEERKKGKEKVEALIATETFDAYINYINQLQWETNQKFLRTQDYKRFKRLYKAQVLSASKETIANWDESIKLDEATEFFEVAQYFDDVSTMQEITDFAIRVFEGTDEEIDAYELQNDLEEYKTERVELLEKIALFEQAISSNKRAEMEKIIDWLFTYREVKRPDLKIKLCEQYIENHKPSSSKEKEITIEAWEGLIEELAETGQMEQANKKYEEFKVVIGELNEKASASNVPRELKIALKQAEKDYMEFKKEILDYDPMQKVLQKHAEAYRETYQFVDEAATRAELLARYNLEGDEAALQHYMLVMAYYNAGNFNKARAVEEELQKSFPTSTYSESIATFIKHMPQ